MIELGVDVSRVLTWFEHEQNVPYIRVSAEHTASWPHVLGIPLRRCYIADDALGRTPNGQAVRSPNWPLPRGARAPDSRHRAEEVATQTRTALSPRRIPMLSISWCHPGRTTQDDLLLCSEVKTKSTNRDSSPITATIADCEKDRTSRVAKTLVWLRDRALGESLGSTTIEHLERFINATDHPPAKKRFRAVAVICSSLVDDELADAPDEVPADYTVVVISVPDLKKL